MSTKGSTRQHSTKGGGGVRGSSKSSSSGKRRGDRHSDELVGGGGATAATAVSSKGTGSWCIPMCCCSRFVRVFLLIALFTIGILLALACWLLLLFGEPPERKNQQSANGVAIDQSGPTRVSGSVESGEIKVVEDSNFSFTAIAFVGGVLRILSIAIVCASAARKRTLIPNVNPYETGARAMMSRDMCTSLAAVAYCIAMAFNVAIVLGIYVWDVWIQLYPVPFSFVRICSIIGLYADFLSILCGSVVIGDDMYRPGRRMAGLTDDGLPIGGDLDGDSALFRRLRSMANNSQPKVTKSEACVSHVSENSLLHHGRPVIKLGEKKALSRPLFPPTTSYDSDSESFSDEEGTYSSDGDRRSRSHRSSSSGRHASGGSSRGLFGESKTPRSGSSSSKPARSIVSLNMSGSHTDVEETSSLRLARLKRLVN